MALKRIQKEFNDFMNDPVDGSSIGYDTSVDAYKFVCYISGPANTAYEGGLFQFDILFPNSYPFKYPKIMFNTKIFHPNVLKSGEFTFCCYGCNSGLEFNWSPAFTSKKIIQWIKSELININSVARICEETFNHTPAGIEYIKDKENFYKIAREYTNIYAL